MKPESHYKVGDRVKIVDKRPQNAKCGWVPGVMDAYLGRYAQITFSSSRVVSYKLNCDGSALWRSEDCFDEISKTLNYPENPDFDVTEVEFLQLLGV